MGKEYQEAWDQVKLSPEADERIRRALIEAQHRQNKVIPLYKDQAGKKATRKISSILIAATMILALSVTAFAAANYIAFFDAFFGTGAVAPAPTDSAEFSQEADGTVNVTPHDYTYEDEKGSHNYTLPGYQLVAVNEDEANRLLGPYVTELNGTYTVDGYTVTLLGYLQDEAGSCRLYYSIENPDGLDNITYYDENGYTKIDFGSDTVHVLAGGSTAYADMTRSTDTKAYVCVPCAYSGVLQELGQRGTYVWIYGANTYGSGAEVEFDVTADTLVPAVTATGDSYEVVVSPMGARVTSFCQQEDTIETETTMSIGLTIYELVITMADGSEYVVESADNNIRNTSYLFGSGKQMIFCFNRIIDPADIVSVTVTGITDVENNITPIITTETISFSD